MHIVNRVMRVIVNRVRPVIDWIDCRLECGVTDGAVYSCQRPGCIGAAYNQGWADGYVMGDRDAINHIAEG